MDKQRLVTITRQIIWGGLPTRELIHSLYDQERDILSSMGLWWPRESALLGSIHAVTLPRLELSWQKRLVWESPGLYQEGDFIEVGDDIFPIGVEHPTTDAALTLAEYHPLLEAQGRESWFFNPVTGRYELE